MRVLPVHAAAALDLSLMQLCAPSATHCQVTILGIIAVIIVWSILNSSASGLYECLDVGLSYIQIMSTIFTFDDVYPAHSSNYKAVVTISDLINLNVDYVSPSCIIPSGVWRYHRPALCQRMVRSTPASFCAGAAGRTASGFFSSSRSFLSSHRASPVGWRTSTTKFEDTREKAQSLGKYIRVAHQRFASSASDRSAGFSLSTDSRDQRAGTVHAGRGFAATQLPLSDPRAEPCRSARLLLLLP